MCSNVSVASRLLSHDKIGGTWTGAETWEPLPQIYRSMMVLFAVCQRQTLAG